MNFQKVLLTLGFYLLAIVLIIWPAIYNGFPLVYSDSGTYLHSSTDLITPMDRPIYYGFFLRITAMKEYTWIAVIMQGLIGAFLIKDLLSIYFKKHLLSISLIVLLLLAVFTGLPWYASQLMPDIFTAFAGVCVILLLKKTDAQMYQKILYFCLLFLSIGVHLSNTLIIGLVVMVLFTYDFIRLKGKIKSIILSYSAIFVTCLIGLISHSTINYIQHGVFKTSRGTDLFLAAKCLETPLLKTYMNDNPHHISIPFSDQIDSIPNSTCAFLWDSKSPLNKAGVDRIKTSESYGPVIKDLLSIPKYRRLFLKEMFNSSLVQVKFHSIGSGLLSYQENSAPMSAIKNSFDRDLYSYRHAIQYSEDLEYFYPRILSKWVFNCSILICLIVLFVRKLRTELLALFIFTFAILYWNAFITAGLANIYDRLQVRVVWLLTFTAIVVIIKLVTNYIERKKSLNKLNE